MKLLLKLMIGLAGIAALLIKHVVKAALASEPQADDASSGFRAVHTANGTEYGSQGDGPRAGFFKD